MKPFNLQSATASLLVALAMLCNHTQSAEAVTVKNIVDEAVLPVKQTYNIPGISIGIYKEGQQWVFNYGLASMADNKAVTDNTLFEIGSISKTFTVTLAALAQVRGQLTLNDKVSDHLPALKDSAFGETTLLNLGTHTTGGLPLQVPPDITTKEQLLAYLKQWQPSHAQGHYRTYSNISIGLLGVIAANSLHQDFATLLQQQIFPAFAMKNSYLTVPDDKMTDYAQGYTANDTPIRMNDGVLATEAYSVRTTTTDLLQFIKANMGEIKLPAELAQALKLTHTGYFQADAMTQCLIWEQYPYPADTQALLDGSSNHMVFDATPVTEITPTKPPRADVLLHKTGATNGFAAYIAFVPQQKIGIVILANKNYPNAARIQMAQKIFARLQH